MAQSKAFTLVELPVVRKCETKGFTLIELMVVLALIVLISAVTLPSVTRIFSSGADAMTYNLMSAQLEVARIEALESGAPAGIHAQFADPTANPDLAGAQYSTVITYNDQDGAPEYQKFTQAPGYVPRALPASMAVGEADKFRTGGSWDQISKDDLDGDFTTFSMIFSATGVLVTTVAGQDIGFHAAVDYNGLFSGTTKLWALPAAEPGTTALTIFNYAEARVLALAQRQAYLNESAQYLPVSFYTGMLYLRKGQ